MRVGVVLGSGLGGLVELLADRVETPYSDIADWPVSTVSGHAGKLVTGRVGETEVIMLSGRAHLYEGYTAQQVTFGIHELHRRGVTSLILTNAAGAIDVGYKPGDLVLISDHINLLGVSPLTGPTFVDMTNAYSREYREIAQTCGTEIGLTFREGVYAAVPGPNYETPAEIHYLRMIGADLVGMSTALEVIAARALGMRVLAISCVTNMAAGIAVEKISHQDVLATGSQVQEKLGALLRLVLPKLD